MSMFESARFVRFATLLAVALVLLLSGVVVGAAGGPLIMGAANSAGVTNTSLTTSSTGTALLVTQNGAGTALRGSAVGAGSIGGFFTAANGTGISGVTGAPGSYGVFAQNNGAFGSGGAVRASGGNNSGVVATTSGAAADAVRAINTGGGQALDLVVNAGIAPMSVNSDELVVNLNADQLDGLDSSDFVQNGAAAGGDLSGTYPNPQLAAREAVQHPTLLTCAMGTNWTTSAALAMPVGFWKDRSGVVHLQGSIACAGNATEGGAIFNLPAGYRPAPSPNGVVRWGALASGPSIAQIAVLDDGSGAVVYDGPDSTTADNYISLDGLTFRAEQ